MNGGLTTKIAKLLAGILACAIVGVSMPCASYVDLPEVMASEEAEYTEGTYGDLTYKNYGDHIEISDCARSVTEVEIPAEIDGLPVTVLGDSVFSARTAIKKITFPDSITSIGNYAFINCVNLETIVIPDSVTSIGESAFRYCNSLTSVTLSDSITSLSNYAFYECISLTEVILPEKLESIGEQAFFRCVQLKEISIPDTVANIGTSAFCDCFNLTEISIPAGVTDIKDTTFYNCGITEITIPENVANIGLGAFGACYGLTSITIENPDCEIYDKNGTIYDTATIYGYTNSTAQAYAEKYGCTFVALDEISTESGDANGNGSVEVADAVFILQGIADPSNQDFALSESGIITANCKNPNSSGVDSEDALAIQMFKAELLPSLPA